jgi:hypothetical protein
VLLLSEGSVIGREISDTAERFFSVGFTGRIEVLLFTDGHAVAILAPERTDSP